MNEKVNIENVNDFDEKIIVESEKLTVENFIENAIENVINNSFGCEINDEVDIEAIIIEDFDEKIIVERKKLNIEDEKLIENFIEKMIKVVIKDVTENVMKIVVERVEKKRRNLKVVKKFVECAINDKIDINSETLIDKCEKIIGEKYNGEQLFAC